MPRLALLDDPAGALEYLPLPRLALDNLPRADLAVIAATVGQRPGRRTTARFSVQSRRHGTKLVEIFGFIFADGSGAGLHDRLLHLRAEHRLALPEPLGYDARVNAVWIEEASGAPLPAALTPDRLSTLLDAAAADLAAIHTDTSEQIRPQANAANGADPITHVAGPDLALIVPELISHAALKAALSDDPSGLVHSVTLFDVYKPAAKVGERSMAVRVELLDSMLTLTDERIDLAVAEALARAAQRAGARLRA